MCGISGFWDLGNIIDPNKYSNILKSMTDELKHRGPDGEGLEIIKNLCFGFRRLSIQDLSLKGMQPMFAKNKKGIIVFNGEVYAALTASNHFSNEENVIIALKPTADPSDAAMNWDIYCSDFDPIGETHLIDTCIGFTNGPSFENDEPIEAPIEAEV